MNRAFTLLELIIVIAIILILAAIIFPVFQTDRHSASRRAVCQSHLKQLGLGFAQYVQDYDERFSPARLTSTTGWADAIYPYVKSTQLYQCPTPPNFTEPLTDYFYNSRLARQKVEKLDSVALTILAGEGNDDASTWNSLAQLPPQWRTDKTSPAWRHLDIGNYLFADGHVKSVRANKISAASPQTANTTFAIR